MWNLIKNVLRVESKRNINPQRDFSVLMTNITDNMNEPIQNEESL